MFSHTLTHRCEYTTLCNSRAFRIHVQHSNRMPCPTDLTVTFRLAASANLILLDYTNYSYDLYILHYEIAHLYRMFCVCICVCIYWPPEYQPPCTSHHISCALLNICVPFSSNNNNNNCEISRGGQNLYTPRWLLLLKTKFLWLYFVPWWAISSI